MKGSCLKDKKVRTIGLPKYAVVATGLQALVVALVLIIWALWATWGKFPNSVFMSGSIFLPVLILCVVGMIGLWKGRMFGWVIALLGNGASAAALLFFAGPFAVLPAVLLVYLLVPSVRGFYVRDYYQ